MRTIKDVIDACAVCIRHQKKICIHQKAFAISIKALFEAPKTKSEYNGAMVITEYLTKYPYAVPIRTKTAEEISRKLWVYISMFGPPKIMGSDKGTKFINKIVEKLCNACGIKHRVTSAYHPQANGHTERFNGTLITMLKKHAEENPDDWDKWLPFVLLA
jgi:transposase InsO family protein